MIKKLSVLLCSVLICFAVLSLQKAEAAEVKIGVMPGVSQEDNAIDAKIISEKLIWESSANDINRLLMQASRYYPDVKFVPISIKYDDNWNSHFDGPKVVKENDLDYLLIVHLHSIFRSGKDQNNTPYSQESLGLNLIMIDKNGIQLNVCGYGDKTVAGNMNYDVIKLASKEAGDTFAKHFNNQIDNFGTHDDSLVFYKFGWDKPLP